MNAQAANDAHAPIRAAVRALCADFPGEYWRKLDRERGYPTEFVTALTKAGFLAALIPEAYGGSGLPMLTAAAIMEEIHASGCNGAACHAQMYTMGTLLRHGNAEQKQKYLPAIAKGELRLQAFGVTEPTSGTDTLALRTTAVFNHPTIAALTEYLDTLVGGDEASSDTADLDALVEEALARLLDAQIGAVDSSEG